MDEYEARGRPYPPGGERFRKLSHGPFDPQPKTPGLGGRLLTIALAFGAGALAFALLHTH